MLYNIYIYIYKYLYIHKIIVSNKIISSFKLLRLELINNVDNS